MSRDPKYNDDREFGDRFLPEVKSIMGRILLTSDYDVEDRKRNTDLISLTMREKRIGVRVRRYKYYSGFDSSLGCLYRDEFTIRASKESGEMTEFQKIMAGYGDYFVYGFADEQGEHLYRFVVISYDAFRKYVLNEIWTGSRDQFLQGRLHRNGNGDQFMTFRNDEIPNGIVADSDIWEKVTA